MEKKTAPEYHAELLNLVIRMVAELGLDKAMKILRGVMSTFKV